MRDVVAGHIDVSIDQAISAPMPRPWGECARIGRAAM